MSWNYRLCKWTHHIPDKPEFKHLKLDPDVYYEIKELYYDNKGEINGVRDGTCCVYSETPEGVGDVLKMMEKALEKPMIDLDALLAKWEGDNSETQ